MEQMKDNLQQNRKEKRNSVFATTGFILALVPITITIVGFLFCLAASGGSFSENDSGAVWWLFIALIIVLVPTAPVVITAALVFGILGLKSKRKKLAIATLILIALQIVAAIILGLLLVGYGYGFDV